MKKIIVCPDSFKGCMSAHEVADCIVDTIRNIFPCVKVVSLPLADGGEGTATLLSKSAYPCVRQIRSFDSLKREINTNIYFDASGNKCLIESAETLGLYLIPDKERNPMFTTSFGLGTSIRQAMEIGAKEIAISLGGTATCDAGMGMLDALGFRFYNRNGNRLEGRGIDLTKVYAIVSSPDIDSLRRVRFNMICDVVNPLYGLQGAAHVFALQKGADERQIPELDRGLRNFNARALSAGIAQTGDALLPGAGAAGGIGYALASFLNATVVKGTDFIFNSIGFDSYLADADLLVTGEGKVDAQSLMGKVLCGVLEKASHRQIPVIVLAGKVEEGIDIKHPCLKAVCDISDPNLSQEENMHPDTTKSHLRSALYNLFNNPCLSSQFQ